MHPKKHGLPAFAVMVFIGNYSLHISRKKVYSKYHCSSKTVKDKFFALGFGKLIAVHLAPICVPLSE